MKKIQVVIHEFDENGNETGRTIVSEIEPEKIDDIKNMTNKEKIEFLSRIEQKAIDSSTELKKNLQSSNSNIKKKK
jgi:hypothetical protein